MLSPAISLVTLPTINLFKNLSLLENSGTVSLSVLSLVPIIVSKAQEVLDKGLLNEFKHDVKSKG